MNKALLFASGGSSSFTQTADSLLTNDTVEVLLGLSEGPIKGPVNGPKSFYADGTQIVNDNGEPNFSSFTMDFWPGSTADAVSMALGGFASPIAINTTLAQNVTVTRQGVQTQITAADFRILIQSLYRQDSKGVYTDTLQLKFEYKPTTGTTWIPCFSAPVAPPPLGGSPNGTKANWTTEYPGVSVESFVGDVQVTTGVSAPPPTTTNPARAVTPTGDVYEWNTSSLTWFQLATTPGAGNTIQFSDSDGNHTWTRTLFRNQTGTPTANAVADIWDTGSGILLWNGSAWVTPAAFDPSQFTPDPQFLNNGVWTWKGKVSSNTPVNIRVYVPSTTDTYEYRVTKLSTDTTTQNFSSISWESIEEIKQTSWTFTDLSMLKVIGRASDQFTSIPTWETDAEGRIVKVPTNYDAVARTYTGVWDGTYQLAYTNNPAFVCQDFIENTTYGMSAIYPQTVDKFAFYAWGQYCDGMVPTADGGTQPRWTYNEWITQPRDAKEQAQYIAGAAGALILDDGNGFVTVMVDEDASAVALFTPENVTPDGFGYSYTERLTRANEIIVSFANPQLNGATDKRRVIDQTDIDAYGRIPEDVIAVGCYDVDEALRRGRRRLTTGLTEKEAVSFVTNRKGRYLRLWDVILVADPDQGRGVTGRITAVTGTNSVSLRDPLSLEAGFTYQAIFTIPDVTQAASFATVTLDISTAAGSTSTLTFSEALPANLPEFAAFSLVCQQTVGVPKPYRVLSVDDDSSSGEMVRVTALELNRNKWTFIDTAQDLGTVDYSNFFFLNIDPPTWSTTPIQVNTRTQGDKTERVLTLSWNGSPSQWVSNYTLTWSIDGTPAGAMTTDLLAIDVPSANRGQYVFNLVANGANGKHSTPITLGYDTVGVTTSVDVPRKLQMKNGDVNYDTSPTDDTFVLTQPDPVVFSHPEATFTWRPATTPHPNFAGYKIRIYVAGTVVRTEKIGDVLAYTYDYAKNKLDGLNRSFTFSVCCVDQDGNESAEVKLDANNPPPAAIAGGITLNPYVLNLNFTPPTDLDYGGIAVSISATSGQTDIVYQDKGNPAIELSPGTTYYVKWAAFDTFGTSGLNWSSEFSVTSPKVATTDINDFNNQVLTVVTTVTGEITTLQNDVNEALTEAGVASNSTTQYQLNLQSLTDYVNALTFVQGQKIGDFTQAVKTTADGAQSTLNIIGVKSADGSTFIMDTTKVSDINGVAIATTLSNMTSTINSNTSAITNESITRSTNDSAISVTVSQVQATANSNTATITNEQVTRATADNSLSAQISSVNAQVGTNSANITNEQIARANGDSANAASITTLTATVNNHTASISTVQAVQADHTGKLSAYFGIVAQAGANPAYVIVNATNYGSTIALAASAIALYDTSTATPLKVMEVIGGYAHFSRLTITDGGGKRLIQGPAFGATGNLVEWFGADTVDPTQATIANSTWAQATDGKVYYAGQDLATITGAQTYLGTSASSVSVTGTAFPANWTTPAVTATLVNPKGVVTYQWLISSSKITINTTNNGQTASFTAQLQNSASEVDGTALVIATDSFAGGSKSYQLAVPVTIAGNA